MLWSVQVGPGLLVLGEEARKYGLSTSLLERLHEEYQKIEEETTSLLTNYRSHSGLLMLPSSLFYGSTLQCRVPDSKSHPLAQYPLVFVCSSIKQHSADNMESTDQIEAEVLVQQVQKYIADSWPSTVWGNKDDSPGKVCIMTPSPTQVCTYINQYTGLRVPYSRYFHMVKFSQVLLKSWLLGTYAE